MDTMVGWLFMSGHHGRVAGHHGRVAGHHGSVAVQSVDSTWNVLSFQVSVAVT